MKQETTNRGHRRKGSVMLEFVIAFPLVLVLILAVVQFAHIWAARLVVHYAAYCGARSALVTVCEEAPPNVGNDSWSRRDELSYHGLQSEYCRKASIGDGRNGRARSEAEFWANKAAARVCAWSVIGETDSQKIQGGKLIYTREEDLRLRVPGWGEIPGSGAAERKTRVVVAKQNWNVMAVAEQDFALVTPIVGPIMGWAMDPWHSDSTQRWLPQSTDMTGDAHKSDHVRYPHIRLTETVWLPKPYTTVIAAGDPEGINWRGYP